MRVCNYNSFSLRTSATNPVLSMRTTRWRGTLARPLRFLAHHPRSRSCSWITVAVLVAAVFIVAFALLDRACSRPIVLSGQSLGVLDPRSGTTVGSVKLTSSPGPLAVNVNEIWIATHANDAVVVVDPATQRIEP